MEIYVILIFNKEKFQGIVSDDEGQYLTDPIKASMVVEQCILEDIEHDNKSLRYQIHTLHPMTR